MHSRHRSPGGGGMRGNTVGLGGLASARISPEASLPRNFSYNRSSSFGGGRMPPPKPYQGPPPLPLPPRRADILMEAGRLATEYLITQGVLPPNVLSERWPNGSSRSNQNMEFQLAAEGRTSALARLGNGVPDEGFRSRVRGRRRMRDYDYQWNRENKRNGFLSDKAQTSLDMEYEDESVHGQLRHEEPQYDLDTSGAGGLKAVANDLPSKTDLPGDSDSTPNNFELSQIASSMASTPTAGKEVPLETDCEGFNGSDQVKSSTMETDEGKDCCTNGGLEKQSPPEDLSAYSPQTEDVMLSKSGNNLLQLCSFAKFPTKTRSSLTFKGSKVETIPMTMEETPCDISSQEGPKVLKEDHSENQMQNSLCIDSDVSKDPSMQTLEDAGMLGSALAVDKDDSVASQSLLDMSVKREQASGQSIPELGRCNSVVKERGDKRALLNDDTREGSKKPREWPSTTVSFNDEFFHLHNFGSNPSHPQKSTPPDREVVEVVDDERFFDVTLLPRCASVSGIEFKEEKQLFPGSFKICDLNLMESSDMTGTHDSDPVYGLSSTMEAKNGIHVDVDLSISNSCNRSDDYDRNVTDAKDAVIEVEDDSAKEDEDFDTSDKKTEIAHSSLQNFPNNMDSTGDLRDAQDGYGLMISELLGTDIPNCSSVPADITSMHTEMDLHNGAEILGDDDPIYLSLGEIPITFLGAWEPPPQPFGKPF